MLLLRRPLSRSITNTITGWPLETALACPLTKRPLQLSQENVRTELISHEIDVAYDVKNGLPILNPRMARFLENPDQPTQNDDHRRSDTDTDHRKE
jgi:uncharacterized protein YbaR (Trm112 family)